MYPIASDALLSSEFLSQFEGVVPKYKGSMFEVVVLEKYSQWRDDVRRRETWLETVQRVVEWNMSLYSGPKSKETQVEEAQELFSRIYHLKLFPAGRSLWVGGTKATEKFATAVFNCAALPIDSFEAFCEVFYLLLNGCGVGFSIEEQFVSTLPRLAGGIAIASVYNAVPKALRKEESSKDIDFGMTYQNVYITVGDSKEGWVQALRFYLEAMQDQNTRTITIDYSHIRGKGERIKTFGGKAPGHHGLKAMFEYIHPILNKDGHITSVEAMDICNHIAKNTLTGGNRRAAEIALGDRTDAEFRNAKVPGNWQPQRIMSNNSIVFETKPERKELEDIFESILRSGEPGFINRSAMEARRPHGAFLNPCVTADTWIHTSQGPRQVSDLMEDRFTALVDCSLQQATPFWSTGVKSVFKLTTKQGYSLKCTSNHKILTTKGWKEAGNLTTSDKVVLNQPMFTGWEGSGTEDEGWLLGEMIGDGCFVGDFKAVMRFWGSSKQEMSVLAFNKMTTTLDHRSDCKIGIYDHRPYAEVGCAELLKMAQAYGVSREAKHVISKEIEQASSDFYRGFLRGIFDADGSPQGSVSKGRSVRLTQSNVAFLEGCQRMLLRLGIKSTLYKCRREAGLRSMPDGHGGLKDYECRQTSELIISRSSMARFHQLVGFSEPAKAERLGQFVSTENIRSLYIDKFEADFESLEYLGEEEVFDCTVNNIHRFDANGIIVHNCAEILLAPRGVCNLTTVVVTSHIDNGELDMRDLLRSIELATRVGLRTTNVTIALPRWDAIQKRDRLLGVSMTGTEDAFDKCPYIDQEMFKAKANKRANDTATVYAYEMRVPRPLLVTTVKPEGTLSLLPTVSPGMHKARSPYYLRRLRMSDDSPVAKALIKMGMPELRDPQKPERYIFEFPIKSDTKIKATEEPALSQYRRYLEYQRFYTDHNTSCTLTVAPEEVNEVIDAILENWDDTIACAWTGKVDLDPEIYPYLPEQSVTKEEYDERIKSFPDLTRLHDLVMEFELEQYIEEDSDSEDPSCASGVCPIR